jgi:hypothetical protein
LRSVTISVASRITWLCPAAFAASSAPQRRLPRGQHRDRLVPVGVRGRAADRTVAGQRDHAGVVEEPAKHQAPAPPAPAWSTPACSRGSRADGVPAPAARRRTRHHPLGHVQDSGVYVTLTATRNPSTDDLWSDHLLWRGSASFVAGTAACRRPTGHHYTAFIGYSDGSMGPSPDQTTDDPPLRNRAGRGRRREPVAYR